MFLFGKINIIGTKENLDSICLKMTLIHKCTDTHFSFTVYLVGAGTIGSRQLGPVQLGPHIWIRDNWVRTFGSESFGSIRFSEYSDIEEQIFGAQLSGPNFPRAIYE